MSAQTGRAQIPIALMSTASIEVIHLTSHQVEVAEVKVTEWQKELTYLLTIYRKEGYVQLKCYLLTGNVAYKAPLI